MAAVAFLIRAGDRERAKIVEDDLLAQPSDRRRKEKMIGLARSYRSYELPEETARLVRAVLSSDKFEIKDSERGTLLSLLSGALKKIDDEEGRREVLERSRHLLEERIAQAPGPHAFSLRHSLARLLILSMDQAERGLEEIDFLLRFKPRAASYISLRARALDSLGRSAEAVDVLRALSEAKRRDGAKDSVTEEAWLGIALAHAGDKAAAKEVLTSVLQRLAPDSDLREQASEIMKSL